MSRPVRMIFLLTLPVVVAVTFATMMPGSCASGAPGSDKLHHMLAFAALTLPTALIRPRWAIWAVLATVAYGGMIEVIQPWVGRMRELADLRADAIGAVGVAVAGVVLNRLFLSVRAATI